MISYVDMVGGRKIGKDKVQLLKQALTAASSSLKLANQLLNEIDRMGGAGELPGLVGKYDGRFMVTEAGKKYPVPDNYSAKTRLVYGDRLKMIEGPMGRQFKLVEKLPRVEEEAQLVVKDGQFEALGKGDSYKLLQSAVKYWGGEEGDKLKILLPEGEKNIPFAALEEIVGKKPGARRGEEPGAERVVKKPAEKKVVREERVEKKLVAKKPAAKTTKKVLTKKEVKTTRAIKKAPPEKKPVAAKPTKKEEKAPAKKEAAPIDEEELR